MEIIEELVDDGMEIFIIVSDWLMPGMKNDEFLITEEDLIETLESGLS